MNGKDENCLFCKIVEGTVPSYKIWEDDSYMGILDILPNLKGQTVVLSKRHVDSYAFGLSEMELDNFVNAVKKVANLLEKKLPVSRVHVVFEGMMVDHLHAKLYPAIGVNRGELGEESKEVSFDAYPGYVTTLKGPRASDEELKKLQKQITSN